MIPINKIQPQIVKLRFESLTTPRIKTSNSKNGEVQTSTVFPFGTYPGTMKVIPSNIRRGISLRVDFTTPKLLSKTMTAVTTILANNAMKNRASRSRCEPSS